LAISQQTPYFDRLCIFVLSVQWIVFGSMHFSFHDATVAQIPEFIPEKSMIAVITGMLEVTIGILILVPSTRRWAAFSSFSLLVLYIPAVYNILAKDSALQDLGAPATRTMFRLLLMPNNIFLALCSIHLWRHPSAHPISAARIVDDVLASPRPINTGRATLLVAIFFLTANCAGFIAILVSPVRDHATADLWAMMCLAAGAFIGFLFGVPRINPNAKESDYLLPNTNIETISDWLTKIIVGVGLINFNEIGGFLKSKSDELAASLAMDAPFAMALIVYFFVAGLIQGYLLTRMFLSPQFSLQTGTVETNDTRSREQDGPTTT
jgi:uncharacterized membrane protein